jgi:hypothetical protein
MKTTITLVTAAIALLLASGAGAQTTVYETRDAEGNLSFSDESSPDSRPVEIQKTDTVPAPQPMPREQVGGNAAPGGERAMQPGEESGEGVEGEEYVDYGDGGYVGDDPRARRHAEEYRRNALTPGVEPVPAEEGRALAAEPGAYGEGPGERANEAAERSDISGPNAEYREGHPEHGGGRR